MLSHGINIENIYNCNYFVEPLSIDLNTIGNNTISTDSATLVWSPPEGTEFSSYTVELTQISSSMRTLNRDVSSKTFTSLTAGTEYTFSITVNSGTVDAQSSEAITHIFYTSKNKQLSVTISKQYCT